VAAGGGARPRALRPDGGGNSTSRGDQPDVAQHRAARDGASRRRPLPTVRPSRGRDQDGRSGAGAVRDDFVVMCHTKDQSEQVRHRLEQWLAPRGLAFNEDKTHAVHVEQGFDFLG
jgi:hypothetical protein